MPYYWRFFIFIYLTYRLITVMIIEGDKYKNKGIQQWTSDVKINAKRGKNFR